MPTVTPELPLRDIHLPDTISWWPPAPGWWLLAGLLAALCTAGWLLWRYKQRRRILYRLQDELVAIRQQHTAGASDIANNRATLEKLSVLLRRACLSLYSRKHVASLTADHWLDFLNERTGSSFDNASGKLLTTGPYQRHENIDTHSVSQLIDIIEQQLPQLFKHASRKL